MKTFVLFVSLFVVTATPALAQNSNSSTTTERPRTTTNVNRSKPPAPAAGAPQKAPAETTPKTAAAKKQTPPAGSDSEAVTAAFNTLIDGIRKADVDAVTGVYWNSPRLILFNYNGTVTKGWEQMRKNRESSYPEIKDVKLDVKDVSVTMFGRDGALVSCLWTQSLTYKGTPESVSGRMTLAFKRVGTAWKAVHLHSSSDNPNPTVVPPSEQVKP